MLLGRLVTFDADRPELEDGAFYIGDDELIHAVKTERTPRRPASTRRGGSGRAGRSTRA